MLSNDGRRKLPKRKMKYSHWSNSKHDHEASAKFLSTSDSEDFEENLYVKRTSRSDGSSRIEKQLCAILIILLLIIVALVAVIVVTHVKVDIIYKQCQTPNCVSAAGEMIKMMDFTVNPCQDFYTYACGGWEKNALPPPDKPKWNSFKYMYQQNTKILNKLINNIKPGCPYKGKNSSAICKAKDYYNACMDKSATQRKGNTPMLQLIKKLGSWTITSDPISGTWDKTTWNFMETLIKLNKYKIRPLFLMSVGADDKNSSVNIIAFEQSGLSLGDAREYSNEHKEKYHSAFMEFSVTLGDLLGAGNESTAKFEEIWQFETKLASIYVPKNNLTNAVDNYHKMTVKDLQDLMGNTINLKAFLDSMFNTNIPLSEEILVYTPSYLQKLAVVIKETDKEILANYMMFRAVDAMLPYLPGEFEEASLVLKTATTGVTGIPARWLICVQRIDDVFGFATGALFVQEKFGDGSKAKAEEVIELVRRGFIANLPSVFWMDDVTRSKAVEKANAVQKMVGYPDWILNPNELDKYYKKIDVTADDEFRNALNAKLYFLNKVLDKRGKAPDKTEWHMMPATVNAYYNAQYNEIVFPAGILQRPYYSVDFPMAVNYGALASVAGHELTHGFDNKGSKFDKDGNMVSWWTNDSLKGFQENTKCMVDQYSQYIFGGEHVNGLTTLGENIADNGGIKAAYSAFEMYSKTHSHEASSLPGLNLTDSQLFFLGFAQVWCAHYTPEYARTSLLTDVHSPAKYRVIATLSNNQNFSNAFSCPLGSYMNPKHKCVLW